MSQLAIIADDLSGALDAAAPFAARGFATTVALSAAAIAQALEAGPEVLAVSTDSREIEPEAARDAVRETLAQLPSGIGLFKKIDSRLKGNVAAELDGFSFDRALVIPAIPGFGRWTRDGKLGGFGVSEPIDIAACLGAHKDRALIPDAQSDGDIVAALSSTECDLLVGARGLADARAASMAPQRQAVRLSGHKGKIVLVIGSQDPITTEQVERLRRGRSDVGYYPAPDGVLAQPIGSIGPVSVLHAVSGGGNVAPIEVARRLGDLVERLDLPEDTMLIVSGGATAQALLGRLGIALIEVVEEILPGLPLARAGRFKLITKSGGFGEPDVLVRVLETVRSDAEMGGR